MWCPLSAGNIAGSLTFHLLLESVGYDGATGELELSFYPLGITNLAAEAATIGQPAEVAA